MIIVQGGYVFADGEVEIYPDSLSARFFVSVNTDQARNHHVVDEDMAHGVSGVGDAKGMNG